MAFEPEHEIDDQENNEETPSWVDGLREIWKDTGIDTTDPREGARTENGDIIPQYA